MWVSQLELVNFRSYEKLAIELSPQNIALVGHNGRGKTNLVEAIGFAATHSSHRVANSTALIRKGSDQSVIRLRTVNPDGSGAMLELEINEGRPNRVRVNRNQLPRLRDALGQLRCVVFAPEDLRLIKGDPSDRRRFTDDIMVQVAPRYAGVRAEYDKVVRQRNTLLRSGRADQSALDVWDEQLVRIGSELAWGRRNAWRRLDEHVTAMYDVISAESGSASALYRSVAQGAASLEEVASAMTEELARRRREELARGITLVGPHRDDVDFQLDGHPARSYASHGESWSLALAVKLASFRVLADLAGDPPVLILDDVFAELDEQRRQQLLESISDADQVIATAAVRSDIPEGFASRWITIDRADERSAVTYDDGQGV